MGPKLAHLTDPATPIAVIGLGYVGLPLAVEFGKQRPVIGFDISQARVAELQAGHDSTRETTPEDLAAANQLRCTSDPEALRACRLFIVTDKKEFYPGCTEDDSAPVLERASGLKYANNNPEQALTNQYPLSIINVQTPPLPTYELGECPAEIRDKVERMAAIASQARQATLSASATAEGESEEEQQRWAAVELRNASRADQRRVP